MASRMMISVSVLRPALSWLAVNVFHFGLPLTWLLGLSEIFVRLYFFYTRFESGKWKLKQV